MRIRKGSAGTKDPAAANWDRVFGGGGAAVPLGGESPRDLRQQTCSTEPTPEPCDHDYAHLRHTSTWLVWTCSKCGREMARRPTPSPRPAELDPEDGA